MKELSIEQKARAYDEAFKKAKKNYDVAQNLCNGSQIGVECFKNTLTNIFPELKESKENEDEKIRKAIMACCSDHGHKYQYTGITAQDMLHWLEKQGAQTHAELSHSEVTKTSDQELKPKFHPGDWITNGYIHYKITEVLDDRYIIESIYTKRSAILFEHENRYHLWTIEDAKDGDVLCYKDEISLYKHDIKNCTKQETTFGGFVYYCCYDGKRFIMDSLYSLTEQDKMDIHPATKEQRDTLERTMTNAGYRWNKEKLKLEKI